MKKVIKEILEKLALRPVHDSEQLISSGLIDSMGVISLVLALEKKFEIKIQADEIDLVNFDSLIAIESFIRIKEVED